MAYIQHNNVDKLLRHLIKKINVTMHGFKYESIIGRFKCEKLIINSVPKAGTHLIEQIVYNIPGYRNLGLKTINFGYDYHYSEKHKRKISSIKKGSFITSHIPYSDQLLSDLIKNDIKMIFVVRDPRQILISQIKYIRFIDFTHPAHQHFVTCKSNVDMVKLCLSGIDKVMPSFEKQLVSFSPWMYKDNVLLVRFEDIASGKLIQRDTVYKIADFLHVDIDEFFYKSVYSRMFSKNTSTFVSGSVDSWKKDLPESIISEINNKYHNILETYGYE